MRKTDLIILAIILVLLVTGVGSCRRAGIWLSKEVVPPHADALVLLMGNFTDRVLQTADLYNAGKADKVIIVEESMGGYRGLTERGVSIISHTTQAVNSCIALGVPADSITVLPGDARSTLDEAVIVRDYLVSNPGVDTLTLVSSPYHLRRASMIFRKAVKHTDTPVFIGCSGSGDYTDFNAEKWWRSKEDIQHVVTELLKTGSFSLIEGRKLKSDE